MRILLINQFFWPDAAATSQLLTDVARQLSNDGHEVHVICADSGYAPDSSAEKPQVIVHRSKSLPFVRGIAGRLASYASFLAGAVYSTLTIRKPDVVLTLTTPPLVSLLGNLARFARGSRHYIWEMDMYPDVAVDLQYFKAAGFLDRAVGILADWSRTHANGILALGPCMRDRLIARGVSPEKIAVTDNWADSRTIMPAPFPPTDGPLVTLYSGNLGLAHDTDTISDAMTRLGSDAQFQFVFAGGGARRKPLEALCSERNLKNVQFLAYSDKASLGERLGAGHIGLITQQDKCLGSVVPSKVYGLLAAGRPILYIGPKDSTVAKIIAQFSCGWRVACGDGEALTALLKHLESNRELVHAAGRRARAALLSHYDLPIGVARVCEAIGAHRSESLHELVFDSAGEPIAKERQFANTL